MVPLMLSVHKMLGRDHTKGMFTWKWGTPGR